MELLGTLPLAKLSRNSGCLDDLNAVITNPVTWSHFSVHLFNSTIQSGITVLLVHVVIASSTLIPQPDSIVLNCGWVLLKDLENIMQKDRQNMSISILTNVIFALENERPTATETFSKRKAGKTFSLYFFLKQPLGGITRGKDFYSSPCVRSGNWELAILKNKTCDPTKLIIHNKLETKRIREIINQH